MSLSEEATRKTHIDRAILASGWLEIRPYSNGMIIDTLAVEEFPTSSGPADYILFHRGRPIAVVEGKKVSLAPQNVINQAERYSKGLAGSPFKYGEYHIPFVYATNGEVFWFRDLGRLGSRSRQVSGFHTPEGLEEMLFRDQSTSEKWLQDNAVSHEWLRPYQKEAISNIEDAIIKGKRKMMVAMATGTGKTVTTIEFMHRILASGMAHRILSLVDRRALTAQAVGEMAAFKAEKGLKFDRIYEVYSQAFKKGDLDKTVVFDPKVLPYLNTIILFGWGMEPASTNDIGIGLGQSWI